jgi:hypothetical protein
MKIDELSLSTMTFNALRRGGVEYVDDLLKLGSKRVLGLRQIGARGIEEISAALAIRGYRWTRWGTGPLSDGAAFLLDRMDLGEGPEQRRALARVLRAVATAPVGKVDPLFIAAELEGRADG